jgi:hypothetical protein
MISGINAGPLLAISPEEICKKKFYYCLSLSEHPENCGN